MKIEGLEFFTEELPAEQIEEIDLSSMAIEMMEAGQGALAAVQAIENLSMIQAHLQVHGISPSIEALYGEEFSRAGIAMSTEGIMSSIGNSIKVAWEKVKAFFAKIWNWIKGLFGKGTTQDAAKKDLAEMAKLLQEHDQKLQPQKLDKNPNDSDNEYEATGANSHMRKSGFVANENLKPELAELYKSMVASGELKDIKVTPMRLIIHDEDGEFDRSFRNMEQTLHAVIKKYVDDEPDVSVTGETLLNEVGYAKIIDSIIKKATAPENQTSVIDSGWYDTNIYHNYISKRGEVAGMVEMAGKLINAAVTTGKISDEINSAVKEMSGGDMQALQRADGDDPIKIKHTKRMIHVLMTLGQAVVKYLSAVIKYAYAKIDHDRRIALVTLRKLVAASHKA